MNGFTMFLLIAFLLVSSGTASPRKIPSHLTSCKKNSEDLNQCIVNQLELLRPFMADGIPKYNIPPFEPYSVPRIFVNRTTGELNLRSTLTQFTVTGLTNVNMSKLNVDLTDLSGSVNLAFAVLNVTTLYDMDIMFMKMVPMIGRGQYNGTIDNAKFNITAKAELSPKDEHGHSYLKIVDLKVKAFVGDIRGNMVDTSGNPESEAITKQANELYEGYRHGMIEMLKPLIEGFCEALILDMANDILSVVPFENIFDDGYSE